MARASPSAIPWARRVRESSQPCCTRCTGATRGLAWRRCASAAGRASQRSSNAWTHSPARSQLGRGADADADAALGRAPGVLGAVLGAVDAAQATVTQAVRAPLAAPPQEAEELVFARGRALELTCPRRVGDARGNGGLAGAAIGEIAGGHAAQQPIDAGLVL